MNIRPPLECRNGSDYAEMVIEKYKIEDTCPTIVSL